MKYWAHRGCSQRYPENTQTSFEKAMSLRQLTGIETDVQRTRACSSSSTTSASTARRMARAG